MIYPEILPEDFKGHWKANIDDEAYHSDKSAISSSGLRLMLESPLHFQSGFIEGEYKEPSEAMRFGKAAHMFILEPDKFRGRYFIKPEFGDLRTKVNKEKRDEWLATLPLDAHTITQDDFDKLQRMLENLMKNEVAYNMIKGGVFEASGYFRDPVTGLKCKIRPDILREDLSAMPDLKTTRCARKDFFAKEIWNHRYDVQLAFYCYGVKQILGKEPELPSFIVIENQDPFDVCVYPASIGMMSRAEGTVRKLLNRVKECLDKNAWPGRQENGAETIDLPAWTDWIEDFEISET